MVPLLQTGVADWVVGHGAVPSCSVTSTDQEQLPPQPGSDIETKPPSCPSPSETTEIDPLGAGTVKVVLASSVVVALPGFAGPSMNRQNWSVPTAAKLIGSVSSNAPAPVITLVSPDIWLELKVVQPTEMGAAVSYSPQSQAPMTGQSAGSTVTLTLMLIPPQGAFTMDTELIVPDAASAPDGKTITPPTRTQRTVRTRSAPRGLRPHIARSLPAPQLEVSVPPAAKNAWWHEWPPRRSGRTVGWCVRSVSGELI
jgi:hypothetical protein